MKMKKNKFLTFSFDDCEIYDRRLAEMFRRYGMKATFFLVSDQLGFRCDFHRYGEDTVVERVSPEEIKETYADMEVATHTASHRLSMEHFNAQVFDSAKVLSDLWGCEVRGLAYPGGEYTPEYMEALRNSRIWYARTTEVTHSFGVPHEWLAWGPTCKYDDADILSLAEEFLNYQGREPTVFHIYGHSYEMTRREPGCDFDSFEALLKRLSGREDIVYATNLEVMEMITCMEQ